MGINCQIFTPENYVDLLLDNINYNTNLFGKRILENACGDGNILTVIVKRYIADCKKNKKSNEDIIKGLENDIYAVEIDGYYYTQCLKKLDKLLIEENIDGKVKWNIFNEDYLRKKFDCTFDYIVSNPPYITYRFINEIDRKYIRDNFQTCQNGKFDYCYPFIEKSFYDLASMGKMSYLIPGSIYKTVFGNKLRELIQSKIMKIIDYSSIKIFSEVLVSSSIMVLDKNKNNDNFEYIDALNNNNLILMNSNLHNKWVFSSENNYGQRRFGDFFQVSHVVATLLNEAFILNDWVYNEPFYEVDNYMIEEQLVRDSSSPKLLSYKKKCKIIFPYYYLNNQLCHYTENSFKENFPHAVKYLNQYKEKLDKRKKDKSALWYEYGRSQALATLNRNKLLMSTIITDKVKLYLLDESNIPYSGLFVYPKTNEFNLEDAKKILESKSFYKYVLQIGIHMNGDSYRITSKDILNYQF